MTIPNYWQVMFQNFRTKSMKTFVCRLVNNFYNRQFRVEVCQMKGAIMQQHEYLLQEGVVDDQRIEGYFLDLHCKGYSNTYIDAILAQASTEIECLNQSI